MIYAIVYYNTFVKRDVVVFKNSDFDLVSKIFEMKYKNDSLMTFRIIIM